MRHLEQDLQISLVQWIHLQYPQLLFSISPGGLLTSARVGGKAKKLGYSAGCPDLIFFEPRGKYHGLFIELKTPDGVVSKPQSKWIGELYLRNYMVRVCYSFESAVNTIKEYLTVK